VQGQPQIDVYRRIIRTEFGSLLERPQRALVVFLPAQNCAEVVEGGGVSRVRLDRLPKLGRCLC